MKKISKFIKNNLQTFYRSNNRRVYYQVLVYMLLILYTLRMLLMIILIVVLSATNVQDALDETYTKCFPPTAADDIINLYNDGSSINTVHIGGDDLIQKFI